MNTFRRLPKIFIMEPLTCDMKIISYYDSNESKIITFIIEYNFSNIILKECNEKELEEIIPFNGEIEN